MILVTGAGGKTGLAVIRALAATGHPVRALVHRKDHVARAQEAGAGEVVGGDMRNEDVLDQAVRDVDGVYHICPNVHPEEVAVGRKILSAARAAGVRRFVYHSVLHPQIEAMPHHWNKLLVEGLLLESGLAYTILQPASYMQNILAGWRSIVEEGIYAVPYPPATRLGMVDLEDVAAAAAVVLTEDGHVGATYELAGPDVLTQTAVAGILSRALGRPVRVARVPFDRWAQQAHASGLNEDRIELLLRMFAYYARFGFWGNPRVLTHLLGRAPHTFEAFVARTIRAQTPSHP